jgi:HEAT repeat protein
VILQKVYYLYFAVGTYGDKRAKEYELNVTNTVVGGTVLDTKETEEQQAQHDYNVLLQGWFHFVQTEDGSIPIIRHSKEEDGEVVNTKKAVVAAFQANFMGTEQKEEADPQSLHTSHYKYEASAQDVENGVLRMHRTVNSEDISAYTSHIPGGEVEFKKTEDITYKRGTLYSAGGTTSVKLFGKVNQAPKDDVEDDNLEAMTRGKRNYAAEMTSPGDPDEIKSFNPEMKTNHYESKGTYVCELVGEQRRLLRRRRSDNGIRLGEHVENSLLAFINKTRKAMEKMVDLRHELGGDVKHSLMELHKNTNNTEIAHKIESLVKLEAEYGPLPQYSPAIDDVLDYLKELHGSVVRKDIKMRLLLYFIISPEGSLRSQMALLNAMETAANDDELEAIVMYIAILANPQPQMVNKLEKLISSDVHSTDPLLLAYGAIIPKTSPELHQRMVLFLIDRLPEAETNTTSLLHHILSLGNAGSPRISSYLIDYLNHPESNVQLTAILAMRFLMREPSVQKSLKDLLAKPHVNEDHLTVIAKSLVYGYERAKIKFEEAPFSSDFAEALVALAMNIPNEELHSALSEYLKGVNTPESIELLKILKFHRNPDFFDDKTNTTRFRRGSRWDKSNPDYDIVSPLSVRQKDVETYNNRLAFIWGKKFGGGDINAQIGAGGFVGIANSGDYKLFGNAVARANFYDRSLTILQFLILREKDSSSTESWFYAVIMGDTLRNIRLSEDASVCKTLDHSLHEGKEYTIFDFTFSIFVVVGTLNFNLKATIQFTSGMYIEYCENHGSLSVGAGLKPTLTIKVSAGGDLEIIRVAKAGLTLTATFNYQVLPEVSSELCYKESQIRVKNCIGIYHQWAGNTLELYAWYAWRGWCGWWACTGSKAYKNRKKIGALSISWDLPGSDKLTLWETCDQEHEC